MAILPHVGVYGSQATSWVKPTTCRSISVEMWVIERLQRPDDPLRRQGEVDLDAQHFLAVVIDDVEGADAAAVCQLVVP